MSPKRIPSNTKGVVKEGNSGNVHSSRSKNITKLTNIVMGTEAQGEINVSTQKTNNNNQPRAETSATGVTKQHKPKRNTEQRRPAKFTLDKFLVPIPKQIKKIFTPQKKQNITHSQESEGLGETEQIKATPIAKAPRVITPQTKKKTKCYHPTIRMDYSNEQEASTNGYQSRILTREELQETAKRINKEKEMGDFFGHNLAQIDNLSVFRCILQNPNGINPRLRNLNFQLGLKTCYESCAAVIGLTETNVEWNHYTERENMHQSLKKYWDATSLQVSTSAIRFQQRYKPGGTLSAICGGHWVSRIIEKGTDNSSLGRWTYQGLQGKKPNKVMPILFYRVCQQQLETAGEKTAWKQQYRILQKLFPKEEIDPRRQGVLDLQNFIARKQSEGWDIILLTDGNENLSKPGSWCPMPIQDTPHVFCKEHDGSLCTLIKTCGLVDILAMHHPSSQYPATYARGRNRIDGIFVSPRLVASALRSGMSPFYSFFVGDHRMLYVDFDANLLFGEATHSIVRSIGRGLQLKDPRKVDTYNGNKYRQLEYHKVISKLEKLADLDNSKWQKKHVERYEKLDNKVVEISLYAEKSISRRYSTQYQWSLTMVQVVYAMRFWKLRLKQAKGNKVKQDTLLNHQRLSNLPAASLQSMSMESILAAYKQAIKVMYSHQARHEELRKTYLEELAEAQVFKQYPNLRTEGASDFKSQQIERQINNLNNRENAKRMYYKIGKLLNGEHGGSVSRIDVPDEAYLESPTGEPYGDPKDAKTWKGQWRPVTDPVELEKIIIDMNRKQYNQAENTPFGSGPLADLFGPDGTEPFVQDFIAGKAVVPAGIYNVLQPETQRILDALQKPSNYKIPEIPDITPEQYAARYKALDERTSSSISGLHIGHHKASAEHPDLAWLHSTMMSIPFRKKISPKRWRNCVDVMIPKEEGNFKKHRLRIIRLCESDFNQSLAEMLVHPVGKFFESKNIYPETQYGSRKGKLGVSAVLNKVLTYDIARLVKMVMAAIENDAIGCYDRIIQSIVAAYLLKLGMPIEIVITICQTFRLTKHFIRTAFGISEETYEATSDVPLFGAGQGTTAGPIFWLIAFCLMHEALDEDLAKISFVSACGEFLAERYGDVFVDDSGLGVTSRELNDPSCSLADNIDRQTQQVVRDINLLAQHYERLLTATGGALNIQKCHWQLLTWIWTDGSARLATIEESPGEIKLTSGYNQEEEEVPRKEYNTGYRTLGIYISANGEMKKSFQIHRDISEKFAGLLHTSTLNRIESYFAYTLYFYPKISYALPVTTYTRKECVQIQAPAMAAFLPKIGLNRHTARTIINGPAEYGGLELSDLYTDQGIAQLRLLLGHTLAQDHTSKLISVAMSYLQLIAGAKTLVLNLPFSLYAKWMDRTWLTSIWQFLTMANLKVFISTVTPLREQRQGDSFLMTVFVYAKFKPGELRQINQCRLFHQVFLTSDIATADGKKIDPKYYAAARNDDRRSSMNWPVQGEPSRQAWTVWNKALNYLVEKGKLKQPLGVWLRNPHQQWTWLIRVTSSTLFHQRQDGTWESFTPENMGDMERGERRKWYLLDRGSTCAPPTGKIAKATPIITPEDGDLFTVVWMDEPLVGDDYSPSESQTSGKTEDLSRDEILERFQEIFSNSSDYFHRLIGPFELPTTEALKILGTVLRSHSLLACSDGSFSRHAKKGSHAWIFATHDGIPLLQGAGPIDGHPLLLSPYRTELGGILALLYLLNVIVRCNELREGTVTLFCDNKTALENVFDENPKRGIYPMLAADYDFIVIARKLVKATPITINHRHVKGHYTGDERRVEHDLNDLVDTMSKKFRRAPPRGFTQKSLSLIHELQTAALISEGAIVTSKLRKTIYHNMFASGLKETIQKHTGWSDRQFTSVDWDAHDIVFRSYSKSKRIGVCKSIHGLWHTGAQKVLFGIDADGKCPCCNSDLETVAHVFQCTEELVKQHRHEKFSLLEKLLTKSTLSKPIRECFLQGLQWFLEFPQTVVPSPLANTRGNIHPAEIVARAAYHEQTQIGWSQCFSGRLGRSWGKAIHYTTPGNDDVERRKQSDTKVRWLIKLLLKFTLEIWKYRNEILHGATREEQRRRFTVMLKDKVVEAYGYFHQNTAIVSYRNRYLFERKTLLQRLQGDDDALLGWLNTVEVAIATNEVEQAEARRNAEKFFQPFREAGRNKLRRQRAQTIVLSDADDDQDFPDEESMEQIKTEGIHSPASKVVEQLEAEVPLFVRIDRQRPTPIIIDPTKLFDNTSTNAPAVYARGDISHTASSASSALPGPGPFPTAFLERQFSTDNSSYCPSRRRDLPIEHDSITTSSHSSISIKQYISIQRRKVPESLSFPIAEGTEMQFTTDSSYCPSRRRDLPNEHDSITTSSHSTISIQQYISQRRNVPEFISFTVEEGTGSTASSTTRTTSETTIFSSLESKAISNTGDEETISVPNFGAQNSGARNVFFDTVTRSTTTQQAETTTRGMTTQLETSKRSTSTQQSEISTRSTTTQRTETSKRCMTTQQADTSTRSTTTQLAETSTDGTVDIASATRTSFIATENELPYDRETSPTSGDPSPCNRVIYPRESEVVGMLAFLREKDKGNAPRQLNQLVVEREISLPLSSETIGWMQQESQEASMGLLWEQGLDRRESNLQSPRDSQQETDNSTQYHSSGFSAADSGKNRRWEVGDIDEVASAIDGDVLIEENSAADEASGEEAEALTDATPLEIGQGSSMGEYLAGLEAASRDFHVNGTLHYLENYYGEFYDYDLAQGYYGEGQTAATTGVSSHQAGQDSLAEDTAAYTATYLSVLSVQQLAGEVRQMQLDTTEMEIPFSEQDDPPDSIIDRCPNNY